MYRGSQICMPPTSAIANCQVTVGANGLHKMKPDDTCHPGTAKCQTRTGCGAESFVLREYLINENISQQEQTLLFFYCITMVQVLKSICHLICSDFLLLYWRLFLSRRRLKSWFSKELYVFFGGKSLGKETQSRVEMWAFLLFISHESCWMWCYSIQRKCCASCRLLTEL